VNLKFTIILALVLSLNQTTIKAMGTPGSITDLPPEMVRYLSGFLQKQYDINALAATCRYLHATATQENKLITIQIRRKWCPYQDRPSLWTLRPIENASFLERVAITVKSNVTEYMNYRNNKTIYTETVRQFLEAAYTCIQHIVARKGNNPIELHMTCKRLSEDMVALEDFFTKCSQDHIAPLIQSLHLSSNGLPYLPKTLKKFVHIKQFCVGTNNLGLKDFELLLTFPEIESINYSGNHINIRDACHLLYMNMPRSLKEIYILETHINCCGNHINIHDAGGHLLCTNMPSDLKQIYFLETNKEYYDIVPKEEREFIEKRVKIIH
jgi:hypothetical protein